MFPEAGSSVFDTMSPPATPTRVGKRPLPTDPDDGGDVDMAGVGGTAERRRKTAREQDGRSPPTAGSSRAGGTAYRTPFAIDEDDDERDLFESG